MSLTKRTQALPGWARDWLAAAAAVEVVEAVGAAEAAAGAVAAVAAVAVAATAAGHGVTAASASLAFCGLG